MESVSTHLVDAVADPERRIAETAIRQPKDTIIYVEGELDRKFFIKHISDPKFTFTNIGRKKGKTDVISTVSEVKDSYGIVDMDYDFNSTMLTSPRLADTSQQCCLYSYVTENRGIVDTEWAIKVVRNVCNSLPYDPMINDIRNQMIDRLKFGGTQIENFVEERTKAILYRGHLGNTSETRAPAEGECTWRDVENSNGNPVRDLITNSMSHEYEVFKKKFSKKLSAAGVNDHAITEAIMLLFKELYPGYQVHESKIQNQIHWNLNQLVIDKGNSDIANSFLSKLGLIDD